jgi:hypothetical protein
MRRVVSLSLTASLMFLVGPSKAQDPQNPQVKAALEKCQDRLLKAGVSRETLTADRRIVEAAYPRVSEKLQGHESDVIIATTSAWTILRHPARTSDEETKQQAKVFTDADQSGRVEAFLTAVSSLGKLTVKSDPTGASVRVNGVDWGETEVSKFEKVGDCTIRCEKAGYRVDEAHKTLVKGEPQTHKCVLTPL